MVEINTNIDIVKVSEKCLVQTKIYSNRRKLTVMEKEYFLPI